MPIPVDVDPDARAECPRCYALVRAARWREHDEEHATLDRRLDAIEEALKEPAPDPELVAWPTAEPAPDTGPAPIATGPYRGEVDAGL